MENDVQAEVIKSQFKDLVLKYTELQLSLDPSSLYIIQGPLYFSAIYNEVAIEGNFLIKIILPNDYPRTPPVAQETEGRTNNFHTNPADSTLCLGSSLEVKKRFAEEPSLISFVENLLIPHLYSFSYKEKYGQLPYGELSHGGTGILEYYMEFFRVSNELCILGLLKILADDNYRGHRDCPCESGKRLRQCHGTQLMYIRKIQTSFEFLKDYIWVSKAVYETNQKKIPEKFLIKKIRKLKKMNVT